MGESWSSRWCSAEMPDEIQAESLARRGSILAMNKFDLRPVEGGGVELSGGKLDEPMVFREADAEQRAINLAGFMSQQDGGVVRVLDERGSLVATKEFRDNGLATSRMDGHA